MLKSLFLLSQKELFAEVLVDPENNFVIFLEKLALRNQSIMKYSNISNVLFRWKWIMKFSNRIMLTNQNAMLQNTQYTTTAKI